MDSATEELRRQHIKTLEVLRRFADENARLREAAPCDAVALEKALLRLDARCAAGAAAAARDTMSMREQLATEQSRVQDLEAALANERAKAADENWSLWKQEKTKEIADRRRRKKEREKAKEARLEAKKLAGKAAYEAWKQNEKRRRKEKRRAQKAAEAAGTPPGTRAPAPRRAGVRLCEHATQS